MIKLLLTLIVGVLMAMQSVEAAPGEETGDDCELHPAAPTSHL